MARRISEEDLEAIVGVVRQHEGATAQQIARTLGTDIPLRTLQYRLKQLVTAGRLTQEGGGRSAKYRMPAVEAVGVAAGAAQVEGRGEAVLPLSKAGLEIQKYVRRPPEARKPVGYNREIP